MNILTSMMPQDNSSSIRIHPWVGDQYGNASGIFRQRTLILGGSHYSDEYESFQTPEGQKEWADFTSEIVEYYLDDNIQGRWKGTYSKFINSIYGDFADDDQRRNLFESIIFYNYLQEIAGGGPSDAYRYDYTEDRHFHAFIEVLTQHRPDVVISWGAKVWDALPNDWGYGPAVVTKGIELEAGKSSDIYDYPFGDSTIRLVGVRHPSSAFDRDFHHSLFKRLNLIA